MTDAQVVTFGEDLLRLATPGHERFTQARSFDVIYGGTESNVAVSLAHYGVRSHWVSAVPANDIGQACINFVRQYGVDTSHVLRRGKRLGTYYIEMGSAVRPSKVVYDRASSAFSELKPGDIDWRKILAGKTWFHFTGISAAVSSSAAAACAEATEIAKEMGLTVSCDLNYRAALWTPEECQEVMRPMMRNVDVLMGGREDARVCLNVSAADTPGSDGLDYAACEKVIEKLREEFGFKRVGLTLRRGAFADENDISAVYHDGAKAFHARPVSLNSMVDRIGGGDAFTAGIIFANINNWDGQRTADFAVAADAMAHTIPGDFNLAWQSEVEAVSGGRAGRVQR